MSTDKPSSQKAAGAATPATETAVLTETARAAETARTQKTDAGADRGLRLYVTRMMMKMSPRVQRHSAPGEQSHDVTGSWFFEKCADVAVIVSGDSILLHSTMVSAKDWDALNAIVRKDRREFLKAARKVTKDQSKIVILFGLWTHSSGDVPPELAIYAQVSRDQAVVLRKAQELAEEDTKSYRILLNRN